jgi:hypothetical protein
MKAILRFHFAGAVLYGALGLLMGLGMAISGDHRLFVAHAHLNLLGWVTVFLYGLYLRNVWGANLAKLLWVQAVAAHLGVVVMTLGLIGLALRMPLGEPLAAVGALLAILGFVLFGAVVWKCDFTVPERR